MIITLTDKVSTKTAPPTKFLYDISEELPIRGYEQSPVFCIFL